jgi:hypothetical protein
MSLGISTTVLVYAIPEFATLGISGFLTKTFPTGNHDFGSGGK